MTTDARASIAALTDLQHRIIEAQANKEAAKLELKRTGDVLDKLEAQMIAAMEESGLSNFRSELGQVVLSNRFSVRLPQTPEDWDLFWAFTQKHGHYEALRTVNSQRLNAWYKAEMEAAKSRKEIDFEVPGLMEPTVQQVLSLRA